MTCPSCGHENPDGQKFCGECGSRLVVSCPSCGSANPPGQKFCGECGTPLGTETSGAKPPPAAGQPAAERRLVSVLFTDLVGFTAASEQRDAEETRELLSRYFETCRRLIELYGGTVEKFIGDAVMAVWGTPAATEDDAERAVRAALDIVASVPQLDPSLTARAGVLTGEAAVTLGAEGQGMVAGDLVNTASRIQSIAEPGTVLVGDATRRASEAAISYEDAGERGLKGRADAVRVWRALRVVANRGGEGRASSLEAPFVGRDRELGLVKDLFHGCADHSRATVVSVVGVAGIGKSRLAWELEKHLDGLVGQVWWHRGRCLAYGESVAFWALAEMVRMRAGIAEDEPESSALTKIGATVREHIPDAGEREWVEPLLRHLLGLGERPKVERADLFSAWRLFFERMSESAPVALVFEDLHWADTALLDFLEHLLEWSRARPIFVLALARPELLERRVDFGAASRSSTTLVLEPLPDDAMNALLEGLVPGLPSDACTQIRERADGIPLYAVETVRMLLDRGTLVRDGDVLRAPGDLGTLDVPETLHALIAARLDGLEPEERGAIEHAAVLGKTFGARGLAALKGVDEASLKPTLERLVRKELLTIDADPRSPERGQYGFLQALVQRVAYDTLARKERGRLHRAAARYLEQEAGIDPDEIAEVIAAHYRDAAESQPGTDEAAEDRRAARTWLERAADRAAALGAPEDAQRAFDDAAAIAETPLERARLLRQAGRQAYVADRMPEAEERLRASVELYTSEGDTHAAAETGAALGLALWQLDRTDDALATLRPALDALSGDEQDVAVGNLAAEIARIEFFSGDVEQGRRHIETALDIAEAHGDVELLSQALNTKSLMLQASRSHERHALLRESLRLAEEHELFEPMLRTINNLVVLAYWGDRRDEVAELTRQGLRMAQARGHRHYTSWFGGALVSELVEEGDWDGALELAEQLLPEDVASPTGNVVVAYVFLAKACFERGDDEAVRRWLSRVPAERAESADQQNVSSGLFVNATAALADGRLADGIGELERVGHHLASLERWSTAGYVLEWGATGAVLLGEPGAAAPLADLYDAVPEVWRTRQLRVHGGRVRAIRAIGQGDENGAADAYAEALAAARNLGQAGNLAPVLTDYGIWLVSCAREAEAAPLLDEAEALWQRMGAQRWLERIAGARPAAAIEA